LSEDRLAHRSSRGVFVTFGGFASRTLIQLGSVMVLSRLLSPADFGLLAMIMALVGVVDLIRDFGLTGAILQRREIDDAQWRGLMWLSIAVGLGLTLIVTALAPLIAWLYGEPRLVLLTRVIAPTLLINGLLSPVQARIQRDLRFTTLAAIEAGSQVFAVILAILAAFQGWGVWALVVQAGVAQLSRLVALWVAAPPSFGRPHIPKGVLSMVRVGGDLLGVQLLNYASRNVDNVLIGNRLGPDVLGQYTRAYSLFLLPMQQLNATLGRVALPVLSRLQDDPDRYRRYIRGGSRVIGYVTIPIYAVLAAVSQPLILIMLGDGWQEAATIFSILALAGVAQAMGNMQGWLFLTLERTKDQLVFFLLTRPLIIAGFFVGLWWNGVQGLALIYGLLSLALLAPGYYFAIRGTHVKAADVMGPMVRPVILAPLCYLASLAAANWASGSAPLLEVAAGGLAGGTVMVAAALVPGCRRDYAAIIDYVKKARRSKEYDHEPPRSEPEAGETQ
jgi:O-antigen/teichoic acid export membrane protein